MRPERVTERETRAAAKATIVFLIIGIVLMASFVAGDVWGQSAQTKTREDYRIIGWMRPGSAVPYFTMMPTGTWNAAPQATYACGWSRCKAWKMPEGESVWLPRGIRVSEADGEYILNRGWGGWRNVSKKTDEENKRGR